VPRLLLLCEYPTLFGGERSLLATLPAVQQAGFEVFAAVPDSSPLACALRDCGARTVPLEVRDPRGRRYELTKLRGAIAGLIRHLRPDLLHANSLAVGRMAGPVAADMGLPSLAHLRDILKLSRRATTDLACNTRLLAVSHATREYHVAGGLPPEKVYVVYNGVDLERFRPRAASGYLHRELLLSPAAKLVGSIGQVSLRKGLDVLLAAALLVAQQAADAHFVIVGGRFSQKEESKLLEENLHRDARQGARRGRVHFLGVREDVPQLLNELTLLAHAARQEPLGRVLLESAASGCPIVATSVGGTPEIFPPDAQAARLVPPDDSELLATEVLALLDGPPLRRSLAARARRRAEIAFDARKSAAAMVQHYQAVLAHGAQ